MKYAFIREHEQEFRTQAMCRVLGASRSGYYQWRRRTPSARAQENERLVEKIKTIHAQSRGTYGSPKVWQQLRQDGETVNRKRVVRLMKESGLRAKRARKFRATTTSQHSLPVAENTLARRFQVNRPDEVWTADITYLWTGEGWLYLAVFIDLYSRLVVGWATSERLTSELVEAAFRQAQHRRGVAVSPLVHSDRGSQYASAAFRKQLAAWGCQQSMSRKGNCWDNAVTESFFGVLKCEAVHGEEFQTRRQATDSLFDYIEVFYNRRRLHSAANYSAPAEYEAQFHANCTPAT